MRIIVGAGGRRSYLMLQTQRRNQKQKQQEIYNKMADTVKGDGWGTEDDNATKQV